MHLSPPSAGDTTAGTSVIGTAAEHPITAAVASKVVAQDQTKDADEILIDAMTRLRKEISISTDLLPPLIQLIGSYCRRPTILCSELSIEQNEKIELMGVTMRDDFVTAEGGAEAFDKFLSRNHMHSFLPAVPPPMIKDVEVLCYLDGKYQYTILLNLWPDDTVNMVKLHAVQIFDIIFCRRKGITIFGGEPTKLCLEMSSPRKVDDGSPPPMRTAAAAAAAKASPFAAAPAARTATAAEEEEEEEEEGSGVGAEGVTVRGKSTTISSFEYRFKILSGNTNTKMVSCSAYCFLATI